MTKMNWGQYFGARADELDLARRGICAYGSKENEPCDCKYGISNDTKLESSEKTGCPELRHIIRIYREASRNALD